MQAGRWEARVGIPGCRHVFLGLFANQEEAARAYDAALVRLRGRSAVTNFANAPGQYSQDLMAYHRLQQVQSMP